MIPDLDVVRICESYQTECECIWIRILESGFLNPDSWIRILESRFRNFYADPRFASDPYRMVRTPPSDLIGLELLMYVRVTRHLDHLWGTGNAMPCSWTMPSRSGKSQTRKHHVYHYHLTVNSPEPTRHGRASIPVRLAGLGFFLRMTRCRVWDFNADKPEFLDADKNLKAYENQTDNRTKDSYKTPSSFWANSQCKKIFVHSFFVVDLIRFM